MTALSGTVSAADGAPSSNTSTNMSGLSTPPALSTSMRASTVRVSALTVGATKVTVPFHSPPGSAASVTRAGSPTRTAPRSFSYTSARIQTWDRSAIS